MKYFSPSFSYMPSPRLGHGLRSRRYSASGAGTRGLGRLFRDERELADAAVAQPVAPEAVGGQQLVERFASDLGGDVRRVVLERVDQRIDRRAVLRAVVLLPARGEPGALELAEHLPQRREPDRVGI